MQFFRSKKKSDKGPDTLNRTVRRRLVPFFLIGIVFVLILFSAFEFSNNFREYRKRRQQYSRTLVSLVTDHVRNADKALSLVALLEPSVEGPAGLDELSEKVFETYRYFQKITVTDAEGEVLASYPEPMERRNIASVFHEWSEPEGGQPFTCKISEPYVSPTTGKVTIRMYRQTSSGRFVLGGLELDFLQEVLEGSEELSSVSPLVFLTDSYGNIIAHPNTRYVEEHVNIGGTELIRSVRSNGDAGAREASIEQLFGTRYYAQANTVPSTGWILVDAVRIPALLSLLLRSMVFIAGLMILLLAAVAVYVRSFISQLVVNPLVYFLHIVERSVWEDMPLSIDDNIATFKEFMALQNAFNVMTNRIRERDEELRKYVKAIQEAGFAIYITDFEGRIEYVNPAFTRVTGYRAEEIKGKTPHVLYSGAQEEEYYRRLWSTILDGEVWEEEIVNRRKDGSEYYAHQTIAPIYDARGEIHHFVAIQTDTTERRRVEQRIEESETLYRSIFRDATESIFLVDPNDGSFIEFNDKSHLTLGYSREEFSRLRVQDVEGLESNDDVINHIREILDTGYSTFETEHLTKNGKIRNVVMTVRHLRINEKSFLLSIAHDITDRKRAEQDLRRSEEKYRLLAENSTDLISQHTLEGVYTYASPASKRLLGYEPEELIGYNAYDLFHPEDLQSIEESHEAVQSGDDFFNVIYRIRRKDGSYTWFETVSRMVKDSVTKAHREILAISRDVSERKRIEDELRISKERAEEGNRIKSDFLANISHEVRTPMNSVLGYAQLLSQRLEDSVLRDYVSSIEKSGTMLLSLLNDILDMSKIEAGRLQLEYGRVAVTPFIEDIRQVFDFRVREKGLAFHVEILPSVPEVLLLDEVRTRQILLNLLGNAIKFTEEGEVRIRVTAEVSSDREDTVTLKIVVSDTGLGIPEHQRERIFEAFRQQEGQSSRKYGGTGLGLAITKRLVEAMEGSLDLESEVQRGTTFTVSLPNVRIAADSAHAETPEDEESDREVSAERLQESKLSVQGPSSDVELDAPQEMIERLEDEFLPLWRDISASMIVDDVLDFARRLAELAERHGHNGLASYADSLRRASKDFDVEFLNRLSNEFEGRVGKIREDLSEGEASEGS